MGSNRLISYNIDYVKSETLGKLNTRKSIHDRPHIVEQRSRFSDLEINTIVGKNHQ